MFPPSQGLRGLDIDAISQICGSVSIACWIVVFSPQIIENWRRGSAEGLSVVFITIWLLGDFFNIIGAVLQGVLPTMIILAVYYTLADIVLLVQCFWYKGFTFRDEVPKSASQSSPEEGNGATEQSPLLSEDARGHANGHSINQSNGHSTPPRVSDIDRRHSSQSDSSLRERYLSIDGTHLSPVTPMLGDSTYDDPHQRRPQTQEHNRRPRSSTIQAILFNLGAIILVIASGIFGWWLSSRRTSHHSAPTAPSDDPTLHFNLWGQISGYVCALLYLGSRIPQLLLNYRRKSTEGISMLFFIFACLGNLTYVLSILVYQPVCQHRRHCRAGEASAIYARYMAVNASWLLGSFGTLLLDAGVFVQYFMYRKDEEEGVEEQR